MHRFDAVHPPCGANHDQSNDENRSRPERVGFADEERIRNIGTTPRAGYPISSGNPNGSSACEGPDRNLQSSLSRLQPPKEARASGKSHPDRVSEIASIERS